jgi:hypothetical protein
MSTLCGRRAIVARSSRSPISVRNRRFSTNRDKLNRQIQQVERLVTRRKQRIALSSNRQKFQFCKTKNLAATESVPEKTGRKLLGEDTAKMISSRHGTEKLPADGSGHGRSGAHGGSDGVNAVRAGSPVVRGGWPAAGSH